MATTRHLNCLDVLGGPLDVFHVGVDETGPLNLSAEGHLNEGNPGASIEECAQATLMGAEPTGAHHTPNVDPGLHAW